MISHLVFMAVVCLPLPIIGYQDAQEKPSPKVQAPADDLEASSDGSEITEDVPEVPLRKGIRRTPPPVPSGKGTTATLYTINAPPPGFDGRSRPLSVIGHDLKNWTLNEGAPTDWVIDPKGFVHVSDQPIRTTKEFGDLQLHLEFSLPTTPGRIGSEASSIGVLLQGRYEILLKNSYGRPPNTECSGALLGNHPPCVNAMLPSPGWQTLDVYFSAARFERGEMVAPPRITAMINGILILNNLEISNPSPGAFEEGMPSEGPLILRGSKDSVILRNIWIRNL